MKAMAKIPPADLVVLGLVRFCHGRDEMPPNFMSSPFFPVTSTRVIVLCCNKSMALHKRVGDKQDASRYLPTRLLASLQRGYSPHSDSPRDQTPSPDQ